MSRKLKIAEVTTMTNNDCKIYVKTLEDAEICAKSEYAHACNGDSGGPLWWKTELVGVIKGCICDLDYFPNTFERVSHYFEWIKIKTNIRFEKS